MSNIIYGTVVLAALLGTAEAFPSLYNSNRMGCTIPEMAFAGHMDPIVNTDIVITVMSGTTEVTEFTPGEEYTITVPAYTGTVNMWIHATAGSLIGTDETTHPQATACEEASFSNDPAAEHSFTWTAPDTSDPVTLSVAQATGSSDAYNTNTMDLTGGAGGAAAGPAAAGAEVEGTEVEGEEEADSAFAMATGAFAAVATAIAALAM